MPRVRGWIVQRIVIRAVVADEPRRYTWTEAWKVKRTRGRPQERIELGGEDAFLVPHSWIAAGAGSMDVRAAAWFQRDIDAQLSRTPGKSGPRRGDSSTRAEED